MMHLLFITRKGPGIGGMQKLHGDLWSMLREMEGVRVHRASPLGKFDVSFPVRLVFLSLWAPLARWRVHCGDASLAPLGVLLKLLGVPRVTLTACGLDVIYPPQWYQALLRWSLPKLDHIVCISRATAREVEKRGVTREQISVIPCSVGQASSITIPREGLHRGQTPFLLTIARLVPRKGVPWFCSEALPLILKDFPSLTYLIVGSGPEEKLIKKIVQERGLTGQVHLLGSVSEEEKEECLKRADLLVVPNIPLSGDMEGFGIVCIEASARGIPVAASRLEGLKDAVIDRETGAFFQPCNADACRMAVRTMLRTPFDPRRVSATTMARYSVQKILPLYRRVLCS